MRANPGRKNSLLSQYFKILNGINVESSTPVQAYKRVTRVKLMQKK